MSVVLIVRSNYLEFASVAMNCAHIFLLFNVHQMPLESLAVFSFLSLNSSLLLIEHIKTICRVH